MSSAERALFAYDISVGKITVSRLSQKRSAQLCGVSAGYVEALSRLNEAEFARVRAYPPRLAHSI
jgi:hypothetical protein